MKIFGWIPGIVALWLCAIGVWGIHNVVGAFDVSSRVATAGRLSGDSHMMHGALRADVLDRALNGAQASPAKIKEMQETFAEHANRLNENMAQLEKLPLGGVLSERIAAVKPAISGYVAAGNQAIHLDGSERDQARLSVFLTQFEALKEPSEQLGKAIEEVAHSAQEEVHKVVQYVYWGLFVGFVLAVAGGGIVTQVMRRRITLPLRAVVNLAKAVSQGDLTYPLPTTGRDEIGEVVQAVGEMQEKLTTLLDRIRGGAEALDMTSNELVEGSRQVAQGSQSQSQAAKTMAAGVERLTASINEVTDGATEARDVSRHASEHCGNSEKLVRKVMQDMSALQASVKDCAQVIHSLGEQSKSIRAIVQVIKDIADQTNLLALNAAIEAARAGEQGRGFAVVADEVRKLADRTGQSTQQIANMIDSIQGSVEAAVKGMEQGVHLVDTGTSCAQEAAEAMSQVNEGMQKILTVVDHAAQAMREQSAAANESAKRVSQVAASAEQNAGVARNAVARVEKLHYLADSMKQLAAGFKTRSVDTA